MTDAELSAVCESLWVKHTTWGLTYMELITCSYVSGEDGTYDDLGDLVYTSPEGHEMSRFMCHKLMREWFPYVSGFVAGYNHRKGEETND